MRQGKAGLGEAGKQSGRQDSRAGGGASLRCLRSAVHAG